MRILSPASRSLLLAMALACAVPAASAASLSFDFTFQNVLNGTGDTAGTVSGTISGLQEGTGAASSVVVTTSSFGAVGLGEFVGAPTFNIWTVTNGQITAFDFVAFGTNNTAPAVTDASLFFRSLPVNNLAFRAGLSGSNAGLRLADSDVTTEQIGLTFTPRETAAVIPLPAAGWALVSGLGLLFGLGAVRRRTG